MFLTALCILIGCILRLADTFAANVWLERMAWLAWTIAALLYLLGSH